MPEPMALPGVFITGTDTEIGKTAVTAALLRDYAARGVDAVGMKPIAAGADETPDGWRNEDALALQAASMPGVAYEDINPWCLPLPIAPEFAARSAGVTLSWPPVRDAYARLCAGAQRVLVEGAGGWRLPLSAGAEMPDWVEAAGWPVVLVVGMRLGCLNHALLSAESIARRAPLLGWIANALPPVQRRLEENLDCLRARMPVPCLGQLGCGQQRLATNLLDDALFCFARESSHRIQSAADSMERICPEPRRGTLPESI